MQENVGNLDLTDPTYAALSRSAGRIDTLLKSSAARNNADVSGSLDDFLGAIYALIFAKEGDFTDRTGIPIELNAVQKRAGQLAVGQLRTDGRWMAVSTSTAPFSEWRPSIIAS